MKIAVFNHLDFGHECGTLRTARNIIQVLVNDGRQVCYIGRPSPTIDGIPFSTEHDDIDILLLLGNGTVNQTREEIYIIHKLVSNGVKVVSVVYDTIPLYLRNRASLHQEYMASMLYTAAISDKIITPSDHSKSQVLSIYPSAENKTETIYLPNVFPKDISIKPKSERSNTVMFVVGGLDPRKRVDNVLRAITRFNGELTLTLVGAILSYKDILPLLQRAKEINALVLTGGVDDQQLIELYRNSMSTIFISEMEGFGLPIIESFACGTPVITNRESSLGEIGGEAAIYVDRNNIAEIADTITRIHQETETWEKHSLLGLDRAKLFDRDRFNQRILGAIIDSARQSKPNIPKFVS